MMVIVKKPRVDIAFAEGRLNGGKVHGQITIVNKEMEFRESRPQASTFFRTLAGSVSHAVRKTSRGALLRIFIKYGNVLAASAFAVSRNSQPSPFCTISSPSNNKTSEIRWISGNKSFL